MSGFDTTTRNAGAPDGTNTSPGNGSLRGGGFGGDLQIALYDCGQTSVR